MLAWLWACGCSVPWAASGLSPWRSVNAPVGNVVARPKLAGRQEQGTAQADAAAPLASGPAANQDAPAAVQPLLGSTPLSAAEIAVLADDGWLKLEPGGDAAALPRWRHAALEPLAMLPLDGALLRTHLQAGGVTAANAAILLARRGDDAGLAALERAVRDRTLRPNIRCAAAEALWRLPGPEAKQALRRLAREQAVWQQQGGYLAELHAELLRGVRSGIEPGDQPLIDSALEAAAPVVLIEALRSWGACGWGGREAQVAALRQHADAAVRAEALRALASRGHPQATQFCVAGLNDQALAVRLTAAEGLGKCPGNEATRALLDALTRQEEQVRAAAVQALAVRHEFDAVRRAADDRSWRVRRAAAAALADDATPESRAALRKLLADPSPHVQLAAVSSLGELPLALAGDVLLEALQHPVYRTRAAARDALALRWPQATHYSPDAPPDQRRAMLAELRAAWRTQPDTKLGNRRQSTQAASSEPVNASRSTPGAGAASPETAAISCQATSEELAAVKDALATLRAGHAPAAVLHLRSFGTKLPALLAAISQSGEPLPEAVWHDVLPHIAQEYVWLDLLATAGPVARRQAAAKLAQQATREELPWLVLERMAALGSRESDAAVLRSLLLAVATDDRAAALALARASLSHRSPEIRRMACEQLERFPHSEHIPALLAALEDPQPSVVVAAARALGFQPQPIDTAPLEKLLAAPDRALRLAAAISLVRLHSPAGITALERLAHDRDPDVRRLAATAMGELGLPEFVPTLISLLNDQGQVRHAALAALPKAAGHPLPETQVGNPEHSLDAALRWQRLYQR